MEIYMCGFDAASISLHVPESQSWRNPFCYYSREWQELQLRLSEKLPPPNINKVLLTLSFQKFLQQSLKLWPSLLNMCWNMLVVCTSFYLALLSKNMFCMRIFTENLAYFDIFLCLCKVSGQNIRLKVIFQRVKKNGRYFCIFLFGAWPFSPRSQPPALIV